MLNSEKFTTKVNVFLRSSENAIVFKIELGVGVKDSDNKRS